jgi:hypothetical protein
MGVYTSLIHGMRIHGNCAATYQRSLNYFPQRLPNSFDKLHVTTLPDLVYLK